MEAVEIAVFFIAAIIVGSLIITFVTTIDPGLIFTEFSKIIFPQPIDENRLNTVSFAQFQSVLYSCWEKCVIDDNNIINCGTVYINDGNSLTEESVNALSKKYNFCSDCNYSVRGGRLPLPGVVSVSCRDKIVTIDG